MLAFALRADGWYLRQDVIWHKPNPMPESVTDRCTKAHEYIFLLSKSAHYYFNNDIINKPAVQAGRTRNDFIGAKQEGIYNSGERIFNGSDTRNKRSVWTVSTQPLKDAHFAVFPEKLITPCILSSCPENGIVLDPFMGSGTTGVVAIKTLRKYIGCELNPEYIQIAKQRISKEIGFFN
jgi:DNA modification methylase